VAVSFDREGMSIGAEQPRPDGTWSYASLSYPELAHLLAAADTRVTRRGDPPPDLPIYRDYVPPSGQQPTRRLAGVLRVSDDRAHPEADEDLSVHCLAACCRTPSPDAWDDAHLPGF
jgi:hypothetical protein